MKKIVILLLILNLFFLFGCYNDSDSTVTIEELESTIESLNYSINELNDNIIDQNQRISDLEIMIDELYYK